MKASETTRMIALLMDAYPNNSKMTENSVKPYHLALQDLPVEAVSTSIMGLIRTQAFVPTAAEIRREAYHAQGVLTAEQAWRKVTDIVNAGPPFATDALPEYVYSVLKDMGGFSLVYRNGGYDGTEQDREKIRQRFMREYSMFLAAEIKRPRMVADQIGVLDNDTPMGAIEAGEDTGA